MIGLGRLDLLEPLARGGMGEGVAVAVKVLAADAVANSQLAASLQDETAPWRASITRT